MRTVINEGHGREGEDERPGGREAVEGAKGEHCGGVRWDPLHINSLGIDEMIRRGLGRQS